MLRKRLLLYGAIISFSSSFSSSSFFFDFGFSCSVFSSSLSCLAFLPDRLAGGSASAFTFFLGDLSVPFTALSSTVFFDLPLLGDSLVASPTPSTSFFVDAKEDALEGLPLFFGDSLVASGPSAW